MEFVAVSPNTCALCAAALDLGWVPAPWAAFLGRLCSSKGAHETPGKSGVLAALLISAFANL